LVTLIKAVDVSGTVKDISIFTTTIKTGDTETLIVPIAPVSAATITNYSTAPTRRVDLVFGVSYGDDRDPVRHRIVQPLAADERVLEKPAPTIAGSELSR